MPRDNTRYNKKKKTQNKDAFPGEQALSNYYSNTIRGVIVPSETMVTLGFSTTINLTSGNPYYAYPLTPNAAYDVDPAIGSTATQGLTEFAALYSKMRVLGYSGTVDFYNAGINATEFTLLHSRTNNSVTNGGGNVDLTLVDMNPFCQRALAGHAYSGTSIRSMSFSHPVTEIVGSKQPLTDDLYQSDVNTTPGRLIWFLIGCKATTGNVSAYARVRLNLHTRFTDRKLVTA